MYRNHIPPWGTSPARYICKGAVGFPNCKACALQPQPRKNIHFYVITLKLTMKPCSRNRDIPILFHIYSLHLITHRRRRIKNRNQYTFFFDH